MRVGETDAVRAGVNSQSIITKRATPTMMGRVANRLRAPLACGRPCVLPTRMRSRNVLSLPKPHLRTMPPVGAHAHRVPPPRCHCNGGTPNGPKPLLDVDTNCKDLIADVIRESIKVAVRVESSVFNHDAWLPPIASISSILPQ